LIRVACPDCGRTFRTKTEGMGKTAVCSGCGGVFRIGSALPPFTWKKSNNLAEDSWVGVEAPEVKKERKHCIVCQALLDEDDTRCPACGTNQVTGLIHKKRSTSAEQESKGSFLLSVLPIRALSILAVIALVVVGVTYVTQKLLHSAADDGTEMLRVRIIQSAAKAIAAEMDEQEFAKTFAGKINDKNLPRFAQMLEAADPLIRKAAAPLIACGTARDMSPIIEKHQSPDAMVSAGAIQVLRAIGPLKLVNLSNDPQNKTIRKAAADGLIALFDLHSDPTDSIAESSTKPLAKSLVESLAEPLTENDKIDRLNELCGRWPRAVGDYQVIIDDEICPLPAHVRQVGRSFYLTIGSGSFVSQFDAQRTFVIPVEHWIAATGPAVDARGIREWVEGTITLISEFGADWHGHADVTARKAITSPLPGFLPVGTLEANKTVTLPIELK